MTTPHTDVLVPLPAGMAPLQWQIDSTLALRGTYHQYRNTLIAGATGVGKGTWLASMLVKLARRGKRALFVVNRGELLDDVLARARAIDPLLPYGVVKSTKDDPTAPIVFAGSATIANVKRAHAIGRVDHLFWDEVHHLPAAGGKRVLDVIRGNSPDLRVTGTTATAFRSAGGGRTTGLGEFFEAVIAEYPLAQAQRDGVLCPLRGLALPPVWKGDADDSTIAAALDSDDHNEHVVRKHLEHGRGRAVVFCTTVGHAVRLAAEFRKAGIKAEAVWEDSKKEGKCPDRAGRIAASLSGDLEVLTNVGLLAEGWNNPAISVVHIVRTTGSLGLFCQMVGRATRLHPTKPDGGLILDYGGNCDRLNLASPADLTVPAHRRPRIEVGAVVRHRRISKLAEGVVEEIRQLDMQQGLVNWRGYDPDWHDLDDLVFLRDGRTSEPLKLCAGIAGLREYEVALVREAPDVGFYVYDKTWTASASHDGGRVRYHIRKTEKWDVWLIRVGSGRGSDRLADTAAQLFTGLGTPEDGMRAAVSHMKAEGYTVQPFDTDWRKNPCSEKQRNYLKSLGIRRDLSETSAGEASAMIDAMAARRLVGDILDPVKAANRERARAIYRQRNRAA